jgi:hypothetical protein
VKKVLMYQKGDGVHLEWREVGTSEWNNGGWFADLMSATNWFRHWIVPITGFKNLEMRRTIVRRAQ